MEEKVSFVLAGSTWIREQRRASNVILPPNSSEAVDTDLDGHSWELVEAYCQNSSRLLNCVRFVGMIARCSSSSRQIEANR